MNVLLIRKGLTVAIILKNDHEKYDEALNQANSGNYQKLILLMSQLLERTLNIYISSSPNNDYDFQEISNIASEPNASCGQEYNSLLARQGKIDAHQEGRNWFTTKKAIKDYIASRKRMK